MNYRHAYHAGNFADVLKHAVLALVIEHLKRKTASFRVVDTHAGRGVYLLDGKEAARTLEWSKGIARLLGPAASPLPTDAAHRLAPYLAAVRASNTGNALVQYPGSPVIARFLLRPGDRLVVNELHPADAGALRQAFARDARVKVLEIDGWLALKSLLPPPERRGVILIDPPFEAPDELARMAKGVREALRRFVTGIYLLWYPLKAAGFGDELHASLRGTERKTLIAEIWAREPGDVAGLNGCGVAIVNPTYQLDQTLGALLPFLAERLADGTGAGHRLWWLDGHSG